ncbi:MAG: rRNA maturation RNase YbeY [Verrucomicrobiota bacterium]
MPAVKLPKLHVHNHQQRHKLDLRWLKKVAKAALPGCLSAAKSPDAPLHQLEEIEISLISDDEIARVHGEFLEDPTPTDVITFHHGEILISVDTAERQGLENGQSLADETALYIIHGLMHLGGWDDHEPEEAAEMARVQEEIWKQALVKAA